MPRVFVIRGFGVKQDGKGRSIDFDAVHAKLIAPAVQRCEGLSGGTTAEVIDAGNIRADMFGLIIEADIVICDITIHNANVFYELGVRHALRKKHTVMIKGDPSADGTPFDLSTDRYLKYSIDDPAAAVDDLVATLRSSLHSERETDSPIFLMLPKLTETDPAEVTLVPLDLSEEIERAERAADRGWLRVIAEDLQGQRYEREGLRRVGRAQWSVKDVAGARRSWEKVRGADQGDVEANLALANLYEREYRSTGRASLLELSNQAIRRITEDSACTPAQAAEALALKGRNLKTLWRLPFANAADVGAARALALDRRAIESYDAYREAFERDLNAFYPGLAALQMGHALLVLSELAGWKNLFRQQRDADRAREDLENELPVLAQVVGAAVARAQRFDADKIWADIADADLRFLTLSEDALAANPGLVVQAYHDAIPPDKAFAWDAASGQLKLFAALGIRAATVAAVMDSFGERGEAPGRHLVVFAGHRVDAPDAPPRFPAAVESRASELIGARLEMLSAQVDQNGRRLSMTVLASAARGADLLVHELCADRRIPARLCLPMPPDVVARLAFPEADEWRVRFQRIVRSNQASLLQLGDGAELPLWLQGRPGMDPWERGNRWVMHLADAWGADRVTLLVLWDGHDDGANGGTAQMVRLARAQGSFAIEVIDSRQLLH